MMKNVVHKVIIAAKRKFIEKLKPSSITNHDGKSFTRKRKLTLSRMMTMLLRGITKALQLQLDEYFEGIGCKDDVVSKQAFSKARTNLDPELVRESFKTTAQILCECEDLELYKGRYRLCAIDGSDIALDNAKELKEHFGCSGSKVNAATALSSLCFDPLNNIILDGGLYPYATNEAEAARVHIKAVEELTKQYKAENLYIFDRGYPSKELFAELINANIKFVFRVRKKFNLDFDRVEKKGNVMFFYNGKAYYVRVFNITLPSGETEILVTNLAKSVLSRKQAGELYFKRWGIETKFNSLKNKLELENMSGRRPVTVYQDFWAKLDIANTLAAFEFATNDVIENNTAGNVNKHQQTTNENRLINHFSKRYLNLLTENDDAKRSFLFDELIADVARRPVEIKPDRSSSRKTPRKMKFCDRIKRVFH